MALIGQQLKRSEHELTRKHPNDDWKQKQKTKLKFDRMDMDWNWGAFRVIKITGREEEEAALVLWKAAHGTWESAVSAADDATAVGRVTVEVGAASLKAPNISYWYFC